MINKPTIDTIIEAFKMIKSKHSDFLNEYNAPDRKNNPLTDIFLYQLEQIDSDCLLERMPQLIYYTQRMNCTKLESWLVNNKNFEKWLSPLDQYIFETIGNNEKNKIKLLQQMSHTEEELNEKQSYGYFLTQRNSVNTAIFKYFQDMHPSSEETQKFFKNILSSLTDKQQKSLIADSIKDMPISSSDSHKTILEFASFGIANKVISREEVEILFTLHLLGRDTTYCLMPKHKTDKIIKADELGIHVHRKTIKSYFNDDPKKTFDEKALDMSIPAFLAIIKQDKDLDCDYWLKNEHAKRMILRKNSSNSSMAEVVVNQIKAIKDFQDATHTMKTLNEAMEKNIQVPEEKTNSSFKL